MMPMKKKVIVGILVMLCAAGGYFGWKAKKTNGGPEVQKRYEAVPVERGALDIEIQSTATIYPKNRLEIKPPLAGRMEEILVNEGDMVEAGQIIAWMSSTDRAALLDAARARGKAEMEKWKDVYKATPILAPLAGRMIARNVEPGQVVSASDVLFVMSDTLIVEAQVDETDLARIYQGQRGRVSLDAYPGQSFDAVVDHIAYESETVENVTIYKVELIPKKIPEFVRSGMTASVAFSSQSAAGVLLVPAEAVQENEGKKQVLVPDGSHPDGREFREVKVGQTDGKNVEILEGLAEGDRVLVPQVMAATASDQPKKNPFMPFGPGKSSKKQSGRPPPPP